MPRLLDDVELLRRLVRFDSTSANSNLAFADWIADYLERPGVRIARNPSPDGAKTNLIVTVGPEENPGGDGLVLSGHMDVVPAGDGWSSDPFELYRAGDRYVGRGACDMKGFLALAMNQMARARLPQLDHPLVLVFTYDEEVGTVGARRLAETWTEALPRNTVIGEPTGLGVVRMHKGHLKVRLTLRGRAAHSGYPHLGDNAIEPAALAIVALTDLKRALARERPPLGERFPDVPYVALSVTQIAGGTAVNVIPDRCTVDLSVRLLPGTEGADLVSRIRQALAGALGDRGFELETLGESPPLVLDEGAGIHRILCQELGQHDALGVAFATDGGWLQRLGLRCVVFGPGSIEVAHQPDEYLPAGEFARAGHVLERLVHRCCMAEAG